MSCLTRSPPAALEATDPITSRKDPEALLARFLELADGSDAYFVSGSFSFLPRLPHYREPDHDLDVAVDSALFAQLRSRLRPDETARVLWLPEIALADATILSRLCPGGTSFVHVKTPAGLLDLAHYDVTRSALTFRLGPGLRLTLPHSVLARVETLKWRGIPYRAGPPELAFIPKALAYRWRPRGLPPRQIEDLKHLAPMIDVPFLAELAGLGGLRFLGRRLPRWIDPLAALPGIAEGLKNAAA